MVVKTRRKYNGGRYTRKMNGGAGQRSRAASAAEPNPAATVARTTRKRKRNMVRSSSLDSSPDSLSSDEQKMITDLIKAYQSTTTLSKTLQQHKEYADIGIGALHSAADICSLATLGQLVQKIGLPAIKYIYSGVPSGTGVFNVFIKLTESFITQVEFPASLFATYLYELLQFVPDNILTMGTGAVLLLLLARKKRLGALAVGGVAETMAKKRRLIGVLRDAAEKFQHQLLAVGAEAALITTLVAAAPPSPEVVLERTLKILEFLADKVPGNENLKGYITMVVEELVTDETLRDALKTNGKAALQNIAKQFQEGAQLPAAVCPPRSSEASRNFQKLKEASKRAERSPHGQVAAEMIRAKNAIDEAKRTHEAARLMIEDNEKKYDAQRVERGRQIAKLRMKINPRGLRSHVKFKAAAAPVVEGAAAARPVSRSIIKGRRSKRMSEKMGKQPAQLLSVGNPKESRFSFARQVLPPAKRYKPGVFEDDEAGPAQPEESAKKGSEKKGGRRTRKRRKSRKSRRGGYKYKKRKSKRRRN